MCLSGHLVWEPKPPALLSCGPWRLPAGPRPLSLPPSRGRHFQLRRQPSRCRPESGRMPGAGTSGRAQGETRGHTPLPGSHSRHAPAQVSVPVPQPSRLWDPTHPQRKPWAGTSLAGQADTVYLSSRLPATWEEPLTVLSVSQPDQSRGLGQCARGCDADADAVPL